VQYVKAEKGGLMKLRNALLACASLFCATYPSSQLAAASMSVDQAAKLFGTRPSAFAPDLSPVGDKLVYLAAGPGAATMVHVHDLAKGTDKVLAGSSGKPEQIYSCDFADERWLVCRFGGWVKGLDVVYPVARHVAIDTETGKIRPLGAVVPTEEGGFEQFDGKVIDWLPDERGAILMQRRYAGTHGYPDRVGVDHIQIDPLKVAVLEPAVARDYSYMTDGHGTVRVRSEQKTDLNSLFTGKSSYEFRPPSSDNWLPLPEGDANFTPLMIEKGSNSLYFLKPVNGRDALYRVKLDGHGGEELVASNPNVDIDTVIELGPGQPVVGYRYTDDRTRSIYTDPQVKALGDELAQALPDMPLMNFVGSSRSGDKLLIHAGSDVDPGVFFLLDRKTSHMDPVLNSSDLIDGSGLAPMKAVTIPTSDGKTIPAYVTMRTDLAQGPRPAVVMPHGGRLHATLGASTGLGNSSRRAATSSSNRIIGVRAATEATSSAKTPSTNGARSCPTSMTLSTGS
jgi:hypothetical protein